MGKAIWTSQRSVQAPPPLREKPLGQATGKQDSGQIIRRMVPPLSRISVNLQIGTCIDTHPTFSRGGACIEGAGVRIASHD